MVDNRKFQVDLFVLDHCGFDVILGIDWLNAPYVVIDYNSGTIQVLG